MIRRLLMILSVGTLNISALGLDEAYSPDIEALFHAGLIVTCDVVPGDNYIYTANIKHILKNTSGLEVPKSINVHGSAWGVIGHKNQKLAESYIIYLREYETMWYPYTYEQHEQPLINGKIPFNMCDTVFHLTVDEYRFMRSEMFATFVQENPCYFKAKKSLADYKKKKAISPQVVYFYKWHRSACTRKW